MPSRYFTVILEREEDGGYHAFCPSLKGCHTQGDTLDEAIRNVQRWMTRKVLSMIRPAAGIGFGPAKSGGTVSGEAVANGIREEGGCLCYWENAWCCGSSDGKTWMPSRRG